jgi:hypothetical protein
MILTCEQCKQRKDSLKVQFEIVGDRLLCEGCVDTKERYRRKKEDLDVTNEAYIDTEWMRQAKIVDDSLKQMMNKINGGLK